MKLNKKAIQKELDFAAEELERHGYIDLAHKIDQYNTKLMASDDEKEIPAIRAELVKVEKEAQRRLRAFDKKEVDDDARKVKAKEALQRARRVAERKKVLEDRKTKKAEERGKLKSRSARLDKLFENHVASEKSLREERLARLESAKECPKCGSAVEE
jgi:hypothetical protein